MKRMRPALPRPELPRRGCDAGASARARRSRRAARAPAAAVGGTLLVRDLASGATMTFGNVTEYAWQPRDGARPAGDDHQRRRPGRQRHSGVRRGDVRASSARVGGGRLLGARRGATTPSDLVALKAKNDDKRDGPTQIVLAWSGVGTNAEQLHRSITPPATCCRRRSGSSRSGGRRG